LIWLYGAFDDMGDIFDYHNYDIQRVETREVVKHPIMHRTIPKTSSQK
jgi:hypothetical protein